MIRKLFLRLDESSLNADDLGMITKSGEVEAIDSGHSCFKFSFDDILLDHAMLLLGKNSSRFGFDLWHYLHSADGFFNQSAEDYVLMPDSTADFKRRFSEDLGVAIGTLFMVQTLGLKWETIAQIPVKKNMTSSGKTPDFVGFDQTKQKRVYECKGTTSPHKVDEFRQKAKDQLENHIEEGITKFACVTYVPTSPKLIPPYLFVSDPPLPLPTINEVMAMGIHYSNVLQFIGVETLIPEWQRLLSVYYAVEAIELEGKNPDYKLADKHQEISNNVFNMLRETINEKQYNFRGNSYFGDWRTAKEGDNKIRFFCGVSEKTMLDVVKGLSSLQEKKFTAPHFSEQLTQQDEELDDLFSQFSDGTLFLIDKSN